jgi:hypothetical protein
VSADTVTVTVGGSRARARKVASEVRSEFGALAEPELKVEHGRVVVTIRR